MPSPPESRLDDERRVRDAADVFFLWNRRLHYYLGLYFLFFTWLFSFTGLLLNHPRWEFAQFWPSRVQTVSEHAIQPAPSVGSNLERARDVMRQLGVAGEIQWPAQPPTPSVFAFQVTRPGLTLDITVDLDKGRATVRRTRLNAWGVMHALHTFTGVPAGESRQSRDWALTTMWALSMDAVALGLIVMVFGSYIMWYRLRGKRRGGIIAVVLGLLCCGAFLTVLR
jgi:hypothetical protein